jgi:hypothetical protein
MRRKIVGKNKKEGDLSGAIHFISAKFDEMNDRFDNLEKMFRDLQGAVDAYAKRADAYFQEMVMLSHQVARHERWIRQIAEKVGIKLQSS